MSGYFSSPPPKLGPPAPTPKGGGISPANTKLLAEGRGPLKAPAKPTRGSVTPTERLAKAPSAPKNFTQAAALEKQVKARVRAQFPKLPGFVIDDIVKLQLTSGPKGDAGSQLNAADLSQAQQVGVRPTVPGAILDATAKGLVHPLTDLLSGPSSFTGAASDVANLASNVITPEKVGLTAGLFGAKGLKGAKVGEDAYTAFKAAKEASPEAQAALKEGLKGAKSRYGVEKVARKADLSDRLKAANKTLMEATAAGADPDEAMAAASAPLRGKYAQIDYKGLKELDPATLKELKTHVNEHPSLQFFDKKTINNALTAAVTEGKVPRPHEMRLIEHVFGPRTAAGIVQQAAQHGIGDKVINALNVPRSLMATGDLSGIGRQSLVAGASHPILWGKNFPTAFKAMGSPAFYERSSQAIKDDPLYGLALAAKVSFTDIGEESALAAHEEAFASDYAAKIPGVGRVVKGSARAYVGFLNQMRMDLFKNQVRIAQAAGRNVQDENFLHAIGAVINASTGRGGLPGRAEHLLPAMNTLLFSPRLMLSRINYLNPFWYVKLHLQSPQAAREALRGLFATAGAVSGVVYLASQIPGVKVGSLDPRSADFGKIRIQNTRIDLAGGFQQYIRLAAELAPAAIGGDRSVSSTTGKVTKLGSGFGIPTRLDVLQDFGYNKLSPVGGIAVSELRGKDAVGNPVNLPGQGKKTLGVRFGTIIPNNFFPLLAQDAKDIYNEKHGGVDGITWALGGYGLGAFGVGLQTYGPKPPKATSSSGSSSYFGGPSSSGGSDYFGSP